MRISSKVLNAVANAALVVAVGTLGVSIWYRYLHHQTVASSAALPIQLGIQPGARAPSVSGISYASHERSLLLFLSTSCRHCESGVPFYNKLNEVALASNGKLNVVGVFLQPANEVATFTGRVNLQAKLLPNVDFPRFGIRSTPTVLLVDRQGVVRHVWVGASVAFESTILAELESSHGD